MEIIGLGAAAGIIVSAVCMMFYRKGVRDGVSMKNGKSPSQSFGLTDATGAPAKTKTLWGGKQGGHSATSDDETATMMKRYEAILSYDPYGAARAEFDGGERV